MNALIIFSKAPLPGIAKTRLSPPLNTQETNELARCFILDTIAKYKKIKYATCYLAYTPKKGRKFFTTYLPYSHLLLQTKRKLGTKILDATKTIFAKGYRNIVCIATDSPDLPVCFVKKAFQILNSKKNTMVIGPCLDKGFYLIGMNSTQDISFLKDFDWGRQHIAKDLIHAGEKCCNKIAILPVWFDVDDFNAVVKLAKRLSDDHSLHAPLTRHILTNTLYDKITTHQQNLTPVALH
ncbi:MAG TPA: TIGR04282 family arsenosugar biosynthesis glycosyltransferase [Candidatus Omnitrophota bacterium]|nr:TIGR04282 family arsenosugar biosynthesis glycosyltransferase [Candidatus Omnitrophota bacterium]